MENTNSIALNLSHNILTFNDFEITVSGGDFGKYAFHILAATFEAFDPDTRNCVYRVHLESRSVEFGLAGIRAALRNFVEGKIYVRSRMLENSDRPIKIDSSIINHIEYRNLDHEMSSYLRDNFIMENWIPFAKERLHFTSVL